MDIRRVVTGENADGRSTVHRDGAAPTYAPPTTPEGVTVSVLWVGHDAPANPAEDEDLTAPAWQLGPLPAGGSRWTSIEILPGAVARGMHRTDTVDYVQIVSGEIWLVLESGETLLRTGDCLVQRATEHAWDNRSDQPCVMTSVMLSTLAPS